MSIHKSLTFSNGYLIFVEGDNPNGLEWWLAKDWQKQEFMKAIQFGTMKSMGQPHPVTKSEPFRCMDNGFTYRFIILNDWEPVYLENMDTKKQREIKYIDLTKTGVSNLSMINSQNKVSIYKLYRRRQCWVVFIFNVTSVTVAAKVTINVVLSFCQLLLFFFINYTSTTPPFILYV